jgi:hypothetical protein
MVWFNTKFFWALHCLNRGKPRGIKPELPNKLNLSESQIKAMLEKGKLFEIIV